MIIQRKPAIVAAVTIAVILVILVIWLARSGTKSPGTLGFWPTGTTSDLTNAVSPTPTVAKPRSETSIKGVSESQSSDVDFLACTAEKFSACWKIQTAVPTSAITGSFLEQTQSILPLAKDNEMVDNCIADGISACSNMVIQKKIAEAPSVSACDEYADPIVKQNCLNDIYPKVAIFKDDGSVCNQASDEYGQKYCSDTYNGDKAIRNRDISWCSRLSSADRQNECKNAFYTKVAVDSDDIGFCAKSGDSASAQGCSRAFAMRKMDSTSIESCKKTYTYSSSIPEKSELDRIYRDCLNRLTGEILMAIRANPDLAATKSDEYQQACAAFPELEKKICLEQLTLTQSGWLALPPVAPQVPVSDIEKLAWSGTTATLSGSVLPAVAK